MTFDEWAITQNPKHRPHDDNVELRLLRECWKASRKDVEMVLRTVVRTHLVDDDSWDTEAETNKRMAQLLPDNAEVRGEPKASPSRPPG